VAGDANSNGEMYPDQSLYSVDSVPKVVKKINATFARADQIQWSEGKDDIDYFAPIVADAEAGFGGVLNAFELMKAMIEAGAAGVHFEDQLASAKKCGHMGGKVLVPTREAVNKLVAARLAADVMGVPTMLLARTDAEAADLVTSDIDDNDKPFFTGERTVEGFYRSRTAWTRPSAAAWPTPLRRPDLVRDRHARPGLRQEVRRRHPRQVPRQAAGLQLLAVLQLEEEPGRRHHRQVPARAGRHGLQVPVHHAGRLPQPELLDVQPGLRLRAQQHERLRRAAAEAEFAAADRRASPPSSTSARSAPVTSTPSPPPSRRRPRPRRSRARPRTSSSWTAIQADSPLSIVTAKDADGLEVIRHSTAHLLAYAVKELFPDAQVTIGPVIENGFYYDFSYKRPFTPEDLVAIEKAHGRTGQQG
jgi:hypothetical protein